jgi:hypothetical protein
MSHATFRNGGARSAVWTNGSGAGAINSRHRGPRDAITMSIDIAPPAESGCRADMWASKTWHYTCLPFVTNQAEVLCNRMKAIPRLLDKPNTAQLLAGYRDTSARPRQRPISRTASR